MTVECLNCDLNKQYIGMEVKHFLQQTVMKQNKKLGAKLINLSRNTLGKIFAIQLCHL